MTSVLSQIPGDYYGIDPKTLEVERVTCTAGTLVFHGREFKPRQLSAGRTAEFEIEERFGLREVMFVPEAMRGTPFERMMVEELSSLADAAPRDQIR